MSTQGSTPKPSDTATGLAARAEERFFTLDHVGVVRHFEGMELKGVTPQLKSILAAHGGKTEDALEELRGLPVYTAISALSSGMTIWVKATQVGGVGVVVDAKLFHSTDQSAEADELLTRLVDEIQEKMGV